MASGTAYGKSMPQPDIAGVVAIAFVASLGAALSPGRPTGLDLWDGLMKFVLCAVVVFAASKAPRWVGIVFASVASAAAGLAVVALLGWLALAIAVVSGVLNKRSKVLSAASGALAAQVLLRLDPIGFFGLPSLLAGLAFAMVLGAGYSYGTRSARQFARRAGLATTLATIVVLLVGSMSLLGARADVSTGVSAARSGLSAARAGNADQVRTELDRAQAALTRANGKATGIAARGLRLIPVVAQHQEAVAIATRVGASVSNDAALVLGEVDFSTASGEAGSIDLQVLESAAPRLDQLAGSLVDASSQLASADSPWLMPVARERIAEFVAEIDDLTPQVETANAGASVLPQMLGGQSAQLYFVLFGTPAESRELGGFLGSWALLSAENGQFRIADSGRVGDLYAVAAGAAIRPGSTPPWLLEMARPTLFPQNLTSSPDFLQVGDLARQVIGGITDEPLAGFVYVDAWALIDMLQITGPLTIPLQNEPLTHVNAPRFFFHDQYLVEASTRTEVFESLAAVAREVLAGIQEQVLPGPEELGRILGPAARGGHMQVMTFDETQNAFLRSVHLLRDFRRGDTTDFVGLIQTNALSNKMDLYLQRGLQYAVEIIDDDLRAKVTARLRSVVPDDAPEFTLGLGDTSGFNRVLLSLYTPHALTGVTVNGLPGEHRATREFELERYLVDVTLPPTGEEFVIEFELVGLAPQGESYSLEVWHQPLVNTDQVDVSYNGPDGELSWQGPLVENLVLRVEDDEN